MTYEVAPAAKADLDSIEEYIARDNPDAAERWIARLLDAFDLLATNPGLGHQRRDLTPHPLLFWTVQSYWVIYRHTSTSVEIVAVTQGSRDIAALLRRRSR